MRIFVTVGTGRYDALVRAIDRLPDLDCTLQIGSGRYEPRHHPFFRFKPDLTQDLQAHDLIVTHGGAASLFEILAAGRKTIAVPNLDRSDPHQAEIVERLALRVGV